MAKSKKKQNTTVLVLKYVGLSVAFFIAASVAVFGIVKMSGNGIEYDKAIIECDSKDYSSYVKTITTSTPGNAEINNQIELYKRAMESAKEANDYAAYGQLNAEYQQLLRVQAQTSTTNTSYDYTEADKAKENCKKLAKKQKESDEQTGLTCALSGGIIAIILLFSIVVFGIIDYKKYH